MQLAHGAHIIGYGLKVGVKTLKQPSFVAYNNGFFFWLCWAVGLRDTFP